MERPFLSVIIPTRDRPECIKLAILSLLQQSNGDFEAIICDNYIDMPCKAIFDQYADERFKYITPKDRLSMPDNWEHACSFAQGEYVTVQIDKTVLRYNAIEKIKKATELCSSEIVTWRNDPYVPLNSDQYLGEGRCKDPRQSPEEFQYYDPKEELRRRFSLSVKHGAEGDHYYRGKICFGAYKSTLIDRVKKDT